MYPWIFVNVPGYLQTSMDICKCTRIFTNIHGYTLNVPTTNIHGYMLNVSVDICKCLSTFSICMSMDVCNYPGTFSIYPWIFVNVQINVC